MNWRIIRGGGLVARDAADERGQPAPPPVWSQIVRKRSTIRSPSCSGSPGTTSAMSTCSGRPAGPARPVNSASLPPNQWLTMAGSTPARSAITRTVAPS